MVHLVHDGLVIRSNTHTHFTLNLNMFAHDSVWIFIWTAKLPSIINLKQIYSFTSFNKVKIRWCKNSFSFWSGQKSIWLHRWAKAFICAMASVLLATHTHTHAIKLFSVWFCFSHKHTYRAIERERKPCMNWALLTRSFKCGWMNSISWVLKRIKSNYWPIVEEKAHFYTYARVSMTVQCTMHKPFHCICAWF